MVVARGGLATAAVGINDYPNTPPLYLASSPKDSVTDPWGFFNRECTSFVAWRLNNDNGVSFYNGMPGPNGTGSGANRFGDASNWASHAASIGYPVNTTPAAGSIAVWPASVGHVAYVDAVNSDGTINTEEYNWFTSQFPNGDGAYHTRTEFKWQAAGVQFIHIRDLGSTQMMITGDSAVYAKNSVGPGGWAQEAASGNAQAVAAGGSYQMFLRGDSAVFAKNSTGSGWTQETNPATANAIAISSTGIQLMRTSDAAIYSKNTIGFGGWTQEVGPGNAAAIAVGGNTEMFIRGDAAVFAKSYGSSGWTQETSPGNATAIAVSSTGVQMFIRGDGAVFATQSIGGAWTQETSPGNAAAIAVGGNTQMFIRGDSAVFATTSIGGPWTQETDPGNAVAIAAGADGTQMFRRGDSAVFAKSSIGYGGWVQETDPGTASAIAAG
jgi:surface antigen